MIIEIRHSFTKDADKLSAPVQRQLAIIINLLKNSTALKQVPDCKKLKGNKTAYRIRMGQYRVGFYYEKILWN
jgi:mRNA interferase RelE/StbE